MAAASPAMARARATENESAATEPGIAAGTRPAGTAAAASEPATRPCMLPAAAAGGAATAQGRCCIGWLSTTWPEKPSSQCT